MTSNFLKIQKKKFLRSSEVPFTRSSEVTDGFLQISNFWHSNRSNKEKRKKKTSYKFWFNMHIFYEETH